MAIVAFWIRRSAAESIVITKDRAARSARQLLRELLKFRRQIAIVIGLTIGGTVCFYTFTTYLQKFLVISAGYTKDTATLLSSLSLLFMMVLQPVFGALSDRLGRKPLLVSFGALATLFSTPILTYIGQSNSPGQTLAAMILGITVVSLYTSINGVVKAELFPPEIRAIGVGFPYALVVAVFGGTTELVALSFKVAGHESYFFYYVSACAAISTVVALSLPGSPARPMDATDDF